MNDLERLHKHLDGNPLDWDTRLILADLHEEMGRVDLAKFQRWLVEHRKSPLTPDQGHFYSSSPGYWHWWASTGWTEAEPSCLGKNAWDLRQPHAYGVLAPTRQEAEQILRYFLELHQYVLPHPLFYLENEELEKCP